ncbi:MAG: hypothetical protein AAF355_02365 [Myxococcota bacterium]
MSRSAPLSVCSDAAGLMADRSRSIALARFVDVSEVPAGCLNLIE